MNPFFVVIDLSKHNPDYHELKSKEVTIGLESKSSTNCSNDGEAFPTAEAVKLLLSKHLATERWRISYGTGKHFSTEALLFVNSVFQSRAKLRNGVFLENGDHVELFTPKNLIIQGVFVYRLPSWTIQESPLLLAPDDILRAIVARMDFDEAVQKLQLVCNKLFHFVRTGLWWETVHLPLPNTPEGSEVDTFCSRVAKGARKLVITIPNTNSSICKQLHSHRWENLEHVEIGRKATSLVTVGYAGTCHSGMTDIQTALSLRCIDPGKLVTLIVTDDEMGLGRFGAFEFPNLKCLRVKRFTWADGEQLEKFLRGLPRLEDFDGVLSPDGNRPNFLRFFTCLPEIANLARLSFHCAKSRLMPDVIKAGEQGKFANVTDLRLRGGVCGIRVPFPNVTKLALVECVHENLPTIPEIYPAAIHLTVNLNYYPPDFSWESTLSFSSNHDWFARLVSVNVYPSVGFPFDRLSAAQFVTVLNDDGWHQPEPVQPSGRFLRDVVGHVKELKHIRGLFLFNAIEAEIRFLFDVDWDLEYLGLSTPMTTELFGKIVEKFPRLKYLQVPNCHWKLAAKLRHLVCLLVGPREESSVEGPKLPFMPPPHGFEEFISSKPTSLRLVEYYGRRLFCPSGVTDFRSYLGPDGENVVDAMDFRAMPVLERPGFDYMSIVEPGLCEDSRDVVES